MHCRAGSNASLGRPEHAVGPARMNLQVSPLPVTESSARRAGRDATSRRVYERCRLGVLGRGENASLPQQNQRGPAKLPKTTVYAQRRHMSDADMPQKRRISAAKAPHDVKHRVSPACFSRIFRACARGNYEILSGELRDPVGGFLKPVVCGRRAFSSSRGGFRRKS